MFIRNLYADLLKLKGLPIIYAHIIIPLVTSGCFLAYYAFSSWSVNEKLIGFFQTVGAGFPALIGIFTASVTEQEQNAGACQNMLALPRKMSAFLSKLVLLLILSLLSVALTTAVFWFGFCKMQGGSPISAAAYINTAFIMWCSSIPLYIWQMLLAFRFGKGVSVGAGIIFGLVSALMLTNLGKLVWKYLPASWTGRIPYTYLRILMGEYKAADEMSAVMPIAVAFTALSMVYYLFRIAYWEESKALE